MPTVTVALADLPAFSAEVVSAAELSELRETSKKYEALLVKSIIVSNELLVRTVNNQ